MSVLVQKWNKENQKASTLIEDRYRIVKYAKDHGHGPNQVARCVQSKYPTTLEWKWEYFWDKNEQVRIEKTLNQPPAEHNANLIRDKPLMVDPVIDEKVQKFLAALFKKDGDISNGISSATASFI